MVLSMPSAQLVHPKSTRDAPGAHGLTVPEHVTVAMAEIAGNMREACWPSRSAPGCR